MSDGQRVARVEVPEGTTPEEAEAYVLEQERRAEAFLANVQQQLDGQQPEEGFGARVDREIGQIPRQLGLTARHGIEGAGELAGVFSYPVEYLMERATGEDVPSGGQMGTKLADTLGLPSAETPRERIVGQASKVAIPVGGQAALAAKGARMAPGAVQSISKTLSAAPGAQLAGAVAGGGGAQYSAETGGGPMAQFTAGMLGGFGGAGAVSASVAAGRAITNAVRTVTSTLRGTRASIEQINAALNEVLGVSGLSVDDISGPIRMELIKEMRRALDTGSEVDPVVLGRIADHATVGTTPTRGTTTLDPVHITQERNLAKYGQNSQNPAMQQLGRTQQANDMRLRENLNELGAAGAPEPVVAGERLQASLKAIDAPRKSAVDNAYKAVRDSQGRYANIDVPTFSNMANNALDEGMLGSVLPADVRALLNDVSSGRLPLNVNTMAQLDKRLSGARSAAFNAGNKDAALAVQTVRKALWEAPVESTAGQRALDQYQRARQMAAERFKLIEKNPAMLDALDDVAPDKFVQTYITGAGGKANVRDVAALGKELRTVPEAFQSARQQILAHLKNKAIGASADEAATNFSPHRYNTAMASIGDSKLRIFFSQKELAQLKAVGRVAQYEKYQPTGSAVNNSNTSAMALGALERIAGNTVVAKIPVLRVMASMVADQARNQVNKIEAAQALSPAFTRQLERPSTMPSAYPLILPGAMGMQDQ